jgi:hypothetical protein
MITKLKRYWQSTTNIEKKDLLHSLKSLNLADESIRKYALVKGLFPLKYWRVIIEHTDLSYEDLYLDWENSVKPHN